MAKQFAWSYSKLKNYETCPKRHYHVDVCPRGHPDKVVEEQSEALTWGNQVHAALAARLSLGTTLPPGMQRYEKWCERILKGAAAGTLLTEQKLAITEAFGPTQWFAKDVWFRSIGDVVTLVGNVALIADWKTGKILQDSQQLALMSACVFAHYPDVKKVRSEFVWLKEDTSTSEIYDRNQMADMWRQVWPRIEMLRDAYTSGVFPPKPGFLCRRWCPVSQCEHHGE